MRKTIKVIYFLLIVFFVSCQKEAAAPSPEPDSATDPDLTINYDQFYFTVSDQQLNQIHESRDNNFSLTDPIPELRINEDTVLVKKMKTRGTSASRVRRKSFNVDTETNIYFDNSNNSDFTKTRDFRLLAMPFDFCYIENRIGFGLLQQAGIFPLSFKYVEVLLNDETNGVYFMIENPNDYFLDKNDYTILIRRAYHGQVDSYKFDEGNWDGFEEAEYVAAFDEIYARLVNYQGAELYEQLDDVLNVRQYMQKIAFDFLIKNGDYTDEIYLYDEPGDNQIRFQVLPWDLDDIFAQVPHEVGNDWGVGKRFRDRVYDSPQDILNDVGERLIFSIEDDLDYMIAKDSFLYAVYLEELNALMELITADVIRLQFAQTASAIQPFFRDPEIVAQTNYDIDFCDPQLLLEEIKDKELLLLERREWILEQL